ncbi:hypothetical protein EJ04DRAFT_603600 [Polyplosphaeria fusca]|uniref:Uncharacterized protein n=1 Tax=Polyplosphaeria fusca TaxID=682080 RepID=A0A9P4QZS9_9PLEO|nr:hypothetical protein EJ04DRAFT_603600 [Polyplosphaeria fusca]
MRLTTTGFGHTYLYLVESSQIVISHTNISAPFMRPFTMRGNSAPPDQGSIIPWPFSNRATNSKSNQHRRNSSLDEDSGSDVEEYVTNMQPSVRKEMNQFIADQKATEHVPTLPPASSVLYRIPILRSLTKAIYGPPKSMDADILKDPVKQREVLELTTHKNTSHQARKRRYYREYLKQYREDGELTEVVVHTEDGIRDEKDSEQFERRYWERSREYLHARGEGWDDCYLGEENKDGWVYVHKVEMEGDEEVEDVDAEERVRAKKAQDADPTKS